MNGKTTETEPEAANPSSAQEQPGTTAPPSGGLPIAKRRPLQNPRVRRGLIIGAIVLVVVAVLLWLHYRNRISTDDAQIDGHIIPISPRVSGSVLQVLVNDNQHVTKGQVLVLLDPRDYQAKLDDAQAALALAQARARSANVTVPLTSATTHSGTTSADAELAAAQAGAEQARVALQQASTSDLAVAQANVQKQEAANQKAQADLNRMKPLAAKNEISQQQFDAFQAAATEAASELEAAKQSLALAQQMIAVRKSQLASAEADVERAKANVAAARANVGQVRISSAGAASAAAAVQQAEAKVEIAQLNLSYTSVTAPEDSVVTDKTVQVGQMLSVGQAMLVLIPLKDVWVTANFKETQLANVKRGDRAEIDVDMYGKTFTGRVDSIAGATGSRLSLLPPENATGNYVKVVERIPVKIVFDPFPTKDVLRPGMNVEATIFTH